MKKIKIIVLISFIFLSACSTRDYHLAMVSSSLRTSTQIEHLKHLKPASNNIKINRAYLTCYSYPQALGAYSAGCHPRFIP